MHADSEVSCVRDVLLYEPFPRRVKLQDFHALYQSSAHVISCYPLPVEAFLAFSVTEQSVEMVIICSFL